MAALTDHLRGGFSSSLVVLRRMGKTALIRHLQEQLKADFFGVYVDILPTESMQDLLDNLATGMAACST